MTPWFHVVLSVFILRASTETIDCKKSCTNQHIWCTNHENCVVNCERCSGSIIYCPRTANNCTVICHSQSSCQQTIIDAKSFDSNAQTLTVIIQEPFAFEDGIVKCPLHHGQCNVHCEDHHVCSNVTIDGRDTSYTKISLIANGAQAFYNGVIYASPYGTLDVRCNGYEACRAMNSMQTYPDTLSLNINATGSLVLAQSNVYCPSNSACNMDIKGVQAMENATIYAMQSFDGFDFLCDSTFDRGCSDITMVCGTNYSSSCSMQMTPSNHWQCTNPTDYCNNYVQIKSYESDQVVALRIEFHFAFASKNDHNISLHILHALFRNISDELIANDIKRIDNACVRSITYDMNINQSKVAIDAMIYVCNENTALVLSNLVDIILDKPIYIGTDDGVKDFNAEQATSDKLESFEVIVIVFGSVIALCVMIVVVLCCVNGEKDIQRYRINTMSSADNWSMKRKYRQANREEVESGVSGRELPSVRRISSPEVMERVMSETDDAQQNEFKHLKVSIDVSAIENAQCETNTVTPYAPEEDKPGKDREPGSSPSNEVDSGAVEDEHEVKHWLTYKVGLAEYYQHFIQKGFDSLDNVKMIENKQQLEEIGVFVERDRTQILGEIIKLNHPLHARKYSEEGVPRHLESFQRHTSEGDVNATR